MFTRLKEAWRNYQEKVEAGYIRQGIHRIKAGEPGISVDVVLAIFVAFILAGATLPTAFSQIFNATTAGWTTATVTVWQLLPLLGVVSLILVLIVRRKEKGK